jgi:hypothetical protein
MEQGDYNPYCPVCSACGEDGCCSALSCQQKEDGHYCETYLKHLRFGYAMDEWVATTLYEQLTDEQKQIYDDKWDELYDKYFI